MKMNVQAMKKVAIVLFFVMFLYSGINKIFKFDIKTKSLIKKVNLPYNICAFGMVLVILLEVVGSLIIYYNLFYPQQYRIFVDMVYKLFLVFLVVVTVIYHPPSTKKMIPFLSNLTTFAGVLYLYASFNNGNKYV